ncbi:hypothetical protein [Natrinema halophilum]|uniref:Uncharacterized protein n=1 Tax=Natrinema halophilum TaxID=1699371 RepID=A0A7D5KK39_9EURY|nr:hypothetical protein [Natrinema halophilum]QLG48698.1 hypothetical protein HYG82_07485 [Natrinema halophilum]
MTKPFNRRTFLAGSIALLGGCSTLDSDSDSDSQSTPETTLKSIVLRNRYAGDDVPPEEETIRTRQTGISLFVELDGEVVQWSEHSLNPDEEYIINANWPSTAGVWTVHAREMKPSKSLDHSEWPSVDLGDVVQGDEATSVAVDVIVKETGRIELDATPIT